MFELARTIAVLLRRITEGSDKALETSHERKDRSNARVWVGKPHSGSSWALDVNWVKGGARVMGRVFYRDDVTKQFDIEEILQHIVTCIKSRAEDAKRRELIREQQVAFRQVEDAAKADKRVTARFEEWQAVPYCITFRTPSLTAAAMLVDWLSEFSETGDDLPPKPTLVHAQWRVAGVVYYLREVARLNGLTSEEFDKVLTMNVGDSFHTLNTDALVKRIS